MNTKNEILKHLDKVEKNIKSSINLDNLVSVTNYKNLVKTNDLGQRIWTKAFQKAIDENEGVYIPSSSKPYYIDDTIVIPSNRIIKAHKRATIRQAEGVRVLMFKNEHTVDGSRLASKIENTDKNIAIIGGTWEESYRTRLGYGRSGMYDLDRSYFGVSTLMFFDNIENLYISDVTIGYTAGFSVQVGQIKGGVFENIKFKSCYADGLHINGNTEDLVIRNISGNVGDDLVALNMYDWQHSSVNFGPMKNVLCENLRLSNKSQYKALRIQPGVYYFDDGSEIDCSADNLIIRDVKGINTFKTYFQTPAYKIGTEPERGAVGSGDNIFFENIDVDLKQPIDYMSVYVNSDPIRGNFGAFELGANFKNVYFENINAKLYRKKYPLSGLVSIGPKSCLSGDKEIFDPYLSSKVEKLHFKNIVINGKKVDDIKPFVKISDYNNINNDGHSTAKGIVEEYINEN